MLLQPSTKIKEIPSASANPVTVAGEATPTLPPLTFSSASQLPQLAIQPVTDTASNNAEAPTNTASPQSTAVSLPAEQGTIITVKLKSPIINASHKQKPQAKNKSGSTTSTRRD